MKSKNYESKFSQIIRASPIQTSNIIVLVQTLIIVFFMNALIIIKTQLITIYQKILHRIWSKVINCSAPIHELAPINQIKQCAICLNNQNFEVFLSCEHSFCASCIIEYWHIKKRRQLKCPICRSYIMTMYIEFEKNFYQQQTFLFPSDNFLKGTTEMFDITNEIYHYNSIFSDRIRSAYQIIMKSPFIFIQIAQFFSEEKGIFQNFIRKFNITVYFIITSIYFLSPFDALPEWFYGLFRIMDDLLLFFIIFSLTTFYFITQTCWERIKKTGFFTEKTMKENRRGCEELGQ